MDGHLDSPEGVPLGDQESSAQRTGRRVERHIGRRLVSGFILLVPLLITLWILQLVFSIVDGLFRGEGGVFSFLIDGRPWDVPGIGVAVTLVLLYVIGAFFSGRRVQALQDAVLTKIPVFRTIYGVARQATDALSRPVGHRYRRVVFVEYPRPGLLALGFVTGHIHAAAEGRIDTIAVYIPTVPNPTSGMLAWLPSDQVIETPITVEEAMKAVFSGGTVLPQSSDLAALDLPAQMEQALERDGGSS